MWTTLSASSDSSTVLFCPADSMAYAHQPGELGTPIPYDVRSDNVLTVSLLLCFVLACLAYARSRYVVRRQLKNFFRTRPASTDIDQSDALRPGVFHALMLPATCMLLAIVCYIYATEQLGVAFDIPGGAPVAIALFMVSFLAYFALKWVVYTFVNTVFFGGKKTLQWNHTQLLLTAIEGTLLFPLVLLLVYFDISAKMALVYFCFVLFLNKILSFYKCWNIFFRQKDGGMQIFLYFCALEITPLLAYCGTWLMIFDSLKIKI